MGNLLLFHNICFFYAYIGEFKSNLVNKILSVKY